MVRAKFTVNSITRTKHWNANKGEMQTIDLTPVTSGSEENQRFYEATPAGSIKLSVVNAEVAQEFKFGEEYYVDFTPVKK